MKLKYLLFSVLLIIEAVLLCGLFDVYPLTKVPAPLTESRLLDSDTQSFSVIRDSFLYTKALTGHVRIQMKKEYGWSLLRALEKKHNITIKLYNLHGLEVPAPGITRKTNDTRFSPVLAAGIPVKQYDTEAGIVYAALPVFAERDCLACHRDREAGDLAGVMTFEKNADLAPLLLPERKTVLLVCILINAVFLILLVLSSQTGRINKLFDNYR